MEHWDNAVEQGKHAARVLAGERVPFVHVPYCFSDIFDLSYEFWGDSTNADQVQLQHLVACREPSRRRLRDESPRR